jgi:TRAP-type C4-dicarboxylate transport system substrate-binding protein
MSQPVDPFVSRRLVLAGLSVTAAAAAFPSVALAGDPDMYAIGCSEPADSPTGNALKRWKKAAEGEERGDGRFKLKLKFEDEVGGAAQLVQGLKKGKFTAVCVPSFGLRELVPRLTVFDLPYMLGGPEETDAALKAAKPEIKKALEANGLKLIWMFPMGHRVVFSRTATVMGTDSMKEVPIGLRPGTSSKAMWDALGARASEVPASDVKAKLDAGAIQAVEATLVDGVERGWHEAAKIISLTDHITEVGFLLMSQEGFDALKTKDQEALVADRAEQQTKLTEHVRKRELALVEELRSSGRTVYVPSSGDFDAMKAATQGVHDAWVDAKGKGGASLHGTLRKD